MKIALRVLAGTIILLGFGFISFSQNSVLSEGIWYKISTEETGVYKISYDDLISYGINPAEVDPQNIRLYGNGNGMLPESNDEFRYEDLQENAIMVYGEEDGIFDPEDYILFYGEGPTEWNMNSESGLFEHETNLYTTHTCYFLNFDLGEGKRIDAQPSSTLSENGFSGSFDDYYVHELEENNLIHTGKTWYGEKFEEILSYDFEVLFPNLNMSDQLIFTAKAAGRSSITGNMVYHVNNVSIMQLNLPVVNFPNYNGNFAREKQETVLFNSNDEILNINISYQQPNDSSMAWLDYFEINARRHTVFDQGQLSFRDKLNSMPGDIIKFKIYSENENLSIWHVTDPMNISSQEFEVEPDGIFYKTEVEGIEEFIVFDESEYLSADFIGEVENQNLHALQPIDLMIITHEDFLSQALDLAQLHQSTQGISAEIIEIQKIYNEFSSGVQDVTAIRDFIKYIYEKQLQPFHMNVMLVGNASFDYQDRIENNTNFIPIWESQESLNPVSSYCSDDFFGVFEDNSSQFELGIGRLPVSTTEEVDILVNKITHYTSSLMTMGDWRNRIAFVADDEDGGLHLEQTDELTELTELLNPAANNQKVYLDAFEQEDTPEGQRYPDVNEAINNAVNNGASIIGYTGHGSYLGWAHEQVLTESDIGNWVNPNMYPLIMAATVEFGRIDDPIKNSLAKKIILLENAGAISIYTANRATYAGANKVLQENFYKAILNNPKNSVGEAVKLSKQWSGVTANSKKFNLLGDPALRIAIPFNKVLTETINDIPAVEFVDTIHSGDLIAISGIVTDEAENLLSDFNGTLFLKIYDPVKIDSTLANDEYSSVAYFEIQEEVVYEQETTVINGQFDFEFNYPNISYPEIGNIKLSYYANDELVDAAGYYNGITVGGLAGTNPAYLSESAFIRFYPTIVSDKINFSIDSDLSGLEISIYNLQGVWAKQLHLNENQKGNEGNIDVSELPNGMYIIKAVSPSGTQSFKILKQ